MPNPPAKPQVETCSMQVTPGGDTFVMDLTTSRHEALRVEFPGWVVHQLMRVLPHLDAAIQQKGDVALASLIAYPVVDWNVERAGLGQGIALWLRNDRHADTACYLSLETAAALYHELGDAIARSAATKHDPAGCFVARSSESKPRKHEQDPAAARPS